MRIDALPGDHPLQVLVVLWIGYFISLVAVVEMMPRTFSRFTGFLGSKVNYIMWWCACLVRVRVGVGVGVRATCCRSVCQCFVKAMWNLCMCTIRACMSPGYHPLQVLRQGHVEPLHVYYTCLYVTWLSPLAGASSRPCGRRCAAVSASRRSSSR